MLLPLSWLAEHVAVDLDVDDLAELLTFAGLEVEAIRRPTAGTRGVRVAEVLAVARLEGSDRLWLVEAYDGEDHRRIVCGASNFAPGDRVPAALPGAVLPGPDPGEPLRIERRTIFGHTSEGMLASPRELGVGDDHAGIWVLDPDAPVGADLSEWLGLDDPVLEINVNPDRGYANSVLGVARDVAALTGAPLSLPQASPASGDPGVPVVIDDPRRCRRFDARAVAGVRVGASPAWLQRRLAAAGVRPISNVVDATNHAMLETGHPAHAYDLARLAGPRIEVRNARAGETVLTLDGAERRLHPDDLVIADAGGPVGLAGVMGGQGTEVGQATTDVLLEVAAFDPAAVLRTARRHKLFTEASTRFEKTVPADTVPLGASRCAELVARLADGRLAGGADHHPAPAPPVVIRLAPPRARSWLGMDVDDATQRRLLEAIACRVEPDGNAFAVTAPAYRPDLRQAADLYEEIARLHGYDKVPETVPSSGQAGGRGPEDVAAREVRRALAGGGWSEVVVFPFISDDDVAALGLPDGDRRRETVALVNPLSKEESVLRTSLLPGLLATVRRNVNRQNADVAVFEVGRVFLPPTADEPGADGGPGGDVLPAEPLLLGLAACGAFEPARHDRPPRPADLYDLLGAADLGRRAVGHPALEALPSAEMPYHPGRAARLRLAGHDLGVVGELHPRVVDAYDLPERTLAGELRLDRLVAGGLRPAAGRVPPALPGVRFDVAVVVGEQVPAGAVEAAVRDGAGRAVGGALVASCRLFDVYRGRPLPERHKSLAYALRLEHPERQLTDDDAAAAIAAVEAAVGERVDGCLRR